jgi:hypothetical protein
MKQHTPGPWAIENTNHGIRLTYSDGMIRSHVADLFRAALCEEHGNLKANAHLIAAAPDLLSALEGLAIWDSDEDKPCFCLMHGDARPGPQSHDSYCEAAREAIAKARGEA